MDLLPQCLTGDEVPCHETRWQRSKGSLAGFCEIVVNILEKTWIIHVNGRNTLEATGFGG